jgi:osmotically-inducible protein OsmY
MKKLLSLVFLCIATVLLLQGCAGVLIAGAAATTAAVAHDRRTAGTIVDDKAMEAQIMDRFYADPDLNERSHIGATMYNNVVLLTGQVPTEELRTRAEAMAREVAGARTVYNEIAIAPPTSLKVRSNDMAVSALIKSTMVGNGFDPLRVKVVTETGTVFLMGLVTPAEGDTATAITRQVSGVQRVVTLFEYVESGA